MWGARKISGGAIDLYWKRKRSKGAERLLSSNDKYFGKWKGWRSLKEVLKSREI